MGAPTVVSSGSATSPGPAAARVALPLEVLKTLAERVQVSGMFLAMLDTDGVLVFHDPHGGLFYQRFVVPLLQYPEVVGESLAQRVAKLPATAEAVEWDFIPGVRLGAFPWIEKRRVAGVFVLAAKSEQAPDVFHMSEEVARLCGRLGLDGAWLDSQARQQPNFRFIGLRAEARLVLDMARDLIQLSSLESELDAISGQLANAYEELSFIYQLNSGMKISRGATEFFKQACLDVLDVLNVRGMGVALCGDKPNTWRQEPLLYGQMSLPPGEVQRLAQELTAMLRGRTTPFLSNSVKEERVLSWLGPHARQIMAVPIQRQDQTLGCLFALDKKEGDFDSVDAKLLISIANESSIYLENARLFEDVHDLMMGMLHSLVNAVDAKDAYTCGHSERVAILSARLAQQIGLPEDETRRAYMAGLLHDLGKIGVPEAVLQKSGRLSAEEFDQMKKHPQVGAKILGDVKQLGQVVPGVLHHHERYDGKGYPAALSGQNIPLMGRLICLADCFDAMTTNRTYRRALPLEVALAEIRRCAGTQFDPAVAEAFLRIPMDEIRSLLRDHRPGALQRLGF